MHAAAAAGLNSSTSSAPIAHAEELRELTEVQGSYGLLVEATQSVPEDEVNNPHSHKDTLKRRAAATPMLAPSLNIMPPPDIPLSPIKESTKTVAMMPQRMRLTMASMDSPRNLDPRVLFSTSNLHGLTSETNRDHRHLFLDALHFRLLHIAVVVLSFVLYAVSTWLNAGYPVQLFIADVVISFFFTWENMIRLRHYRLKRFFSSPLRSYECLLSVLDWFVAIDLFVTSEAYAFRLRSIARVLLLFRAFRGFTERPGMTEFERISILTDTRGRIVRYGTGVLFTWGWLLNITGSMLANPRILSQFGVFWALAWFYAVHLCTTSNCDAAVGACSDCFPRVPVTNGLLIASIVGFHLSFFNAMTFNRWWDMRTRLGTVQVCTVFAVVWLAPG